MNTESIQPVLQTDDTQCRCNPDEYGITQTLQRAIGCYIQCNIVGGLEACGYIRYAGSQNLILCNEDCGIHTHLQTENILCLQIWSNRKKTDFLPLSGEISQPREHTRPGKRQGRR